MNRRERKRCKINFNNMCRFARKDKRSRVDEMGHETIYIKPGKYTEPITLCDGVSLVGWEGN